MGNGVIANETEIHARLVTAYEAMRDGRDVNYQRGMVWGIRDMLTLLYGKAEADRVCDVARMEAML